jgi:hypothetical protein
VARASWKFLQTNLTEIYNYIVEYKKLKEYQGKQRIYKVKNYLTINKLNFMHIYTLHQGKFYIFKRFYKYNINSKVGDYLKTTKPFNYKSKKKKKNE